MTTLNFVLPDGRTLSVDAQDGSTVMQAALDHSVPGIVAECGGAMACATCHVIVDEAWAERVGAADDNESAMLEIVVDRRPTSRLACQVPVRAEFHGLTLGVPVSQF